MYLRVLLITIFSAVLSACGADKAIQATNSMPEKMEEMTRKMDETNEAVRLQKVVLAKQGMEDPENARIIFPVPFGIMPYAEKFAENATDGEIIAQLYLYLKEVNEGIYPPKIDAEGNEVELNPAEIQEINFAKLHKFVLAQAISGFLAQKRVERIVQNEIYNDGRFQKTALEMLMMRYRFLRDVLLSSSLLSGTAESVGVIVDAVKYLTQMDWVARRPYLGRIQIRIYGFLPPFEEVYEVLDRASAKESILSLIGDISVQAGQVGKAIERDESTEDGQRKASYQAVKSRLSTALAEMNSIKLGWEK